MPDGTSYARRRARLSIVVALAAATLAGEARQTRTAPPLTSIAGVSFVRDVSAIGIDEQGKARALPFLGGLDVPRPQFVDIDGDADLDLFVQEYSNAIMFFENTGTAAAPVYTWRSDRYQDLDIGEWYRFIDLNGDGLLDLVCELPYSQIRFYRNTGTKSGPAFTFQGPLLDSDGKPMFLDRQNVPAFVDLDCDGRLDLFAGRVEGVVDRFEASAPNVERFDLIAERFEGIEIIGRIGGPGPRPTARHGANALAFADFDADGDQDLFWGDFFEPAVLLIENIGRTCGSPSFQVDPVVLPYADGSGTSGYNAPAPVDLDRDGDLDFLMGVLGGAFNPVRTSADNFFYWNRTAADTLELRSKRFLDGFDIGSDSAPAFGDLDGDGDLDLVVGNKIDAGAGDGARLYVLTNDGNSTATRFRAGEPMRIAEGYNFTPALGDLDADGDLDLVLGTWNSDVLVFRNDGSRTSAKWVADAAATIRPPRVSHATPALGDLDGDGDLDLLLGQANGAFLLYRNAGSPRAARFELVSEHLDDLRAGRRSAPALVDVDGDGLVDIVSGRENAGALAVFRNAGTKTAPRFAAAAEMRLVVPSNGVPAIADVDGDGVADLVLGTSSGGLRFYRGRQ
ncbi:MAG TPA: VCBS repeat-containing protein [Vicinamibacterales bacterium]|nr:VCBS repeat-containing protein [Vicinamibacterales bacterium]